MFLFRCTMFAVFEIQILNAENTPDDSLYDGRSDTRMHIPAGRAEGATPVTRCRFLSAPLWNFRPPMYVL